MPLDRHGQELQAGDEVIMRFKVLKTYHGEQACNVDLKALDSLGTGNYAPFFSVNAKLVEKAS
jgi:hypothetical protein